MLFWVGERGDIPYGHSHTRIQEDIPSVKIEDIKEFYFQKTLVPQLMIISIAGDINRANILKVFEEKFGSIPAVKTDELAVPRQEIPENKLVTLARKDAAQEQIVQGWIGTEISSDDFPAIVLMNVILGSSGLSSRLFLELRDKKGLAYHVRSSLEALKHLGLYTVYIGTAPDNIKTCLEGFTVEIDKLKNELVSDNELSDAKNNYLGKRAFLHETNSQQSYYLGYYDIMGVGSEFDVDVEKKIKSVTPEDVKRVANRYLSQKSVTSILAPAEFLEGITV